VNALVLASAVLAARVAAAPAAPAGIVTGEMRCPAPPDCALVEDLLPEPEPAEPVEWVPSAEAARRLLARIEDLEAQKKRLRDLDGLSDDIAWMGAAAALDIGSTGLALRLKPSLAESNWLGQSIEERAALKVLVVLGAAKLAYELRQHGSPKAAKVLRWILVAVPTAAAANNLARSR
jgi:hypothetical protein